MSANYILLLAEPAGNPQMQSHSAQVYTTNVMSALRCYCIFNFIPQAGWITFRGALQYVVHFLAAVSPRQVLIELDGPVTAPIPHLYPQSPFIYATLYIHHTFIHAVYIIHFYLYIIHSSCQFHHSPKIRLFT